MHVAADLGNVEVVETLLKAACDLKVVDKVISRISPCSTKMVVSMPCWLSACSSSIACEGWTQTGENLCLHRQENIPIFIEISQ